MLSGPCMLNQEKLWELTPKILWLGHLQEITTQTSTPGGVGEEHRPGLPRSP